MARHESTPATSGHVLHAGRSYDLMLAILTLGRPRRFRRSTIALARVVPGEAVLDVGCGTGDLTLMLAEQAGESTRQAHGIDASPEMISVARRKAARTGSAVDFRVGVVEALPFPDARFDLVTSSLMMHHLPDDLKPRALAEIRRVLKPGGRLLIVDFKQPTGVWALLAPLLGRRRHMASDEHKLSALLTAAGFTGVETGGAGFGFLGFVRGLTPR